MIHSAPLDLEQFRTGDSHTKPIQLEVWNYFADHGYPIEEILEAHTTIHKKVDDEDTSHIVLKVETLSRPIDEADAAVDNHTMLCCDCKAYQFHHGVDLEEQRITEWGYCKHCEAVDKSLKAQADESQTELTE